MSGGGDLKPFLTRWEPGEHAELKQAAEEKLGGHDTMADLVRTGTMRYVRWLRAEKSVEGAGLESDQAPLDAVVAPPSTGTTPCEADASPVVDLMAQLEQSVRDARAARAPKLQEEEPAGPVREPFEETP